MKPICPILLAGLFTVVTPVAAQQSQLPPRGLDTLDESRVLTEIASRELEALLRHTLDARGVPDEEREALLSNLALGRLRSGESISTEERRQLVLDIVRNVDRMVAEEPDDRSTRSQADLLVQQSQILIDEGIGEEVQLLEYFGENPERRRYVRPVADAVGQMLRRAAELYGQEADRIEETIVSGSDPRIQAAKEVRSSAQQAGQLALFADYYHLLGLDPDDPDRINRGDDLIRQLEPLDREGNPARGFVQQFIGKLALARGNVTGRERAREAFERSIENLENPDQVFDSYFGRVVVEAVDGKPDAAREQLARLEAWFADKDLPGHDALLLVAGYRVEDAASRVASNPADRQAADDAATDYLVRLIDEHESYRPVVTQQLLARVDAETDLTSLSPLLLDAVVDRSRAEASKLAAAQTSTQTGEPDPEVDRELIEMGVTAARELLSRSQQGDTQIDPTLLARDAFLMGLLLEFLDRPIEAADAYLTYGQLPYARPEQKLTAYRRALGIVDQFRQRDDVDAGTLVEVDRIEAELLPVLVDEYDDTSRAFDLANRLHRMGRLAEAAEYYAKVPEEDPRKPDAQNLLVLAQAQRVSELDTASPDRAALLQELTEVGPDTLNRLEQAAANASGASQEAYRERAARLRVTLARLAINERDEPQAALELLSEIEQATEGLEARQAILADALPLRFQATAATGQIDEATRDLLTLLERSDAQRGLAYISEFRNSLDRAYDRAAVRGDREGTRQIVQTRAAVTPLLVEWIEGSDDPEYRRYAYNFRRFDAETQLQAARLTDDPAEREQRLNQALQAFQELQSPENLERYRNLLEGLNDAQRQQVPYDREVVLNLGRLHYELGNFEEARSRFARLLADRALGEATTVVVEDGVERAVPNDDFWEAQLKFIRSNLELGNAPERMADQLRRLEVIHGDNLGGRLWRREFAQLRQELAVAAQPS